MSKEIDLNLITHESSEENSQNQQGNRKIKSLIGQNLKSYFLLAKGKDTGQRVLGTHCVGHSQLVAHYKYQS